MSGWSEERVEKLRNLIKQRLSARQIAGRIGGVSRNAVIGKVHRLGLQLPGSSPEQRREVGHQSVQRLVQRVAVVRSRRRKAVQSRLSVEQRAMIKEAAEMKAVARANLAPPEVRNLNLIDLGPSDCRWPLGDGPYTFCGCPQNATSRYCDFHHALSIQERMPVAPPAYQSQPMSRVYRTA